MPQSAPLISLLGAPALVDGERVQPLAISEKTLALLVVLACEAGRPISRAWLASILWPDVDEAQARANLRRHFYKLTKALPPSAGDPLVLGRNTAQWNADCGFSVDVMLFEAALRSGDLEQAVRLYRGPLCVGAFDEVILERREDLGAHYMRALRTVSERADVRSDLPKRIALLERLAAHDPLNESDIRELTRARIAAGDRAGARRELTALLSRLRAELNVEPEAETMQLLATCLEAGERFAPTNLPVESDSFVGREPALSELHARLQSSSWVTIAGAAGIGKTRLAVHAARNHLADFPDGIWFVDLSGVTTWDEAVRAIGVACGVSINADGARALHAHFARTKTLLLLDNLEQFDHTARAGIDALLCGSALKVLGTSRKRVGGAAEDVLTLAHLALPPAVRAPSDALVYAAVRLFVERATAVAPSFSLSYENLAHVLDIVTRLDGLPLAIELVAARANLLTIEGIAKRLHDLDAFRKKDRERRHQTVASALRWSYDLLSQEERLLLRCLGIFEGTFDIAAAEAVCAAAGTLPANRVFPVLSELVEASLVTSRRSEAERHRYALLETVRGFVRALNDDSMLQLAASHAQYYAAFVEVVAPYAEGAREADYYGPVDHEYANVRAALDYALEHDVGSAARIVAALYRYWVMRGRLREGLSAASACERDSDLAELPADLQGRFYQAYGILARELGENLRAENLLERALSACRTAGDERRECDVLFAQAKIAFNTGNTERALELYRRCIVLMERSGDEHGRASAIANIGAIAHNADDLVEAERMYRLALAEYQRLGYLRGLAFLYRQLSLLHQNTADYEAAVDFARQSVALSMEIGEYDREADALVTLAGALTEAGRPNEAAAALVGALEILERSENAQFLLLALEQLAIVATALGRLVEAVRFHGFAHTLREKRTLHLAQAYEAELAQGIDRLRSALPKETFAAAWAAGETFSAGAALEAARRVAFAKDDTRTVRSL